MRLSEVSLCSPALSCPVLFDPLASLFVFGCDSVLALGWDGLDLAAMLR